MKEEDLAAHVVRKLESEKWDVYSEVAPYGGGARRADIVGLLGSRILVVETKLSCSLVLLDQAMGWKHGYAHHVMIAVPCPKRGGSVAAEMFARKFGLGIMYVYDNGHVRVAVHAPLDRSAHRSGLAEKLRRACTPEAKRYAAGNARNEYWTPFRSTCEQIQRYIKAHGPTPLKVVLQNIDHHYASLTSGVGSLSTWIEAGKIDGIKLDRSRRPLMVEAR